MSEPEQRVPQPEPGSRPVGFMYAAAIGRHHVRFVLLLDPDGGPPRTVAAWTPERPKKLRPRLLKTYRRERRAFAIEIAQFFGWSVQIIDRMTGRARVTELVYGDGDVVPVDFPYDEAVLH